MLVLSRKPGELVTVGDNITVKVIGFRNGKVRLGFEAPADVLILRDDVPDIRSGRDSGRSAKP